ncbi:protein of unknown function DUF1549 [Isosphaera pallida ATCC 43644]|uniref:Cytochrome c domain-containing protein n=1 Tax=Isosphaera pallida (strain ATCC 43644 / DSM 9630 / IS1B) TaxID=575540 RepID=E8R6A2_ISOPI|nr:PSD1 and planctomycete cytochrome C domain-containing protein [Isosphaera pallida]ADV61803.1 protein of unknown function DUF1549 [Isosphaera pallida ATCC 43644]
MTSVFYPHRSDFASHCDFGGREGGRRLAITMALLTCAGASFVFPTQSLGQTDNPSATVTNSSVTSNSAKPIDYATQVRPILAVSCYRCHGEDRVEGGLRLDVREDALELGGVSGPAITPGDSHRSSLIRRVKGKGVKRMPPEGPPLSPEQIELLARWIDQGATWPEDEGLGAIVAAHWSYRPPVRPHPPQAVVAEDEHLDPIDRFVLNRLRSEGITPSGPAARTTLIRRLSLDLIGLPPTPQEVEAFLADESPQAVERVVDRLLASPRFGERWASWWLDLARYADTHGFEKDPRRTMWRYRDWVIDAFNRDLPFDQFTIEQLAGDMLPNATLEQRIASGFHRNTMINTEGGVDPEEARHHTIVDRVNTTATVWLASTLGCAQCHSHKYDPYRHDEYYRVYALFNNADEPEIPTPTAADLAAAEAHRARVAQAEARLHERTPERLARLAAWEATVLNQTAWRYSIPSLARSLGGASLTVRPDGSVLVSGTNPDFDTYEVVFEGLQGSITALRLDVLPDPTLPEAGVGRHPNGSFVLNRIEVEAQPPDEASPLPIPLASARADHTQPGHDAAHLVADLNDPKAKAGWAIGAYEPSGRVRRSVILTPKTPIDFGDAVSYRLVVRLIHRSSWPQANLGAFRLGFTNQPHPDFSFDPPDEIRQILAVAPDQRDDAQRHRLWNHFLSVDPELKALRAELETLKQQAPQPTTTLVMAEREVPRTTVIRLRGEFLSPGDPVEPGIPAAWGRLPEDQPANRLTFARWLVAPDNPRTSRVLVNRLWEQLFGIGLVRTVEDFGTQGESPSHPELLDELATGLVADGWSVKRLLKRIVMSQTYQRDSRVRPDLVERDPDNRLLARGPRFRLPAEILRDNALAIAGLLSDKIGGPSVFPPQPEGIWTMIYSNDKWIESQGEDRYRRGLYTFWRRTAPYPTFLMFDAPSREVCTVGRNRSNTPLQALATLNDPGFFEPARAFGARIAAHDAADDAQRIDYAYRLAVARPARPREIERLGQLLDLERTRLANDPRAVENLAWPQRDPKVSALDAAAWAVVANVVLNLDETLTKE